MPSTTSAPGPWRRGAEHPVRCVATIAALTLAVGFVGCSDGQSGYCDQLRSLGDLSSLTSAVHKKDPAAARARMQDFDRVARDAPEEIADDMHAIASVLNEVVDVGTGAGGMSEADQERRRDRVNQQLATMPDHSAAVSAWAERECGLHLDD